MLAVSRGVGIGTDDNAGSFSAAGLGADAPLWTKLAAGKPVMNADNGKGPNEKDDLENNGLPARKRPREEEAESPATFFRSSGTTPTGLPVSPTISSTTVAASPGNASKAHGGFGSQIGNFQPIQPHGPLFKEADASSRDADCLLLPKTPEGWHGGYGRGEGDPITESPLILAPDHAAAMKQEGDWDHEALHAPDAAFAVPSPCLVPATAGDTPEESRGGKEAAGGAAVEAPFELCCITPTHSLFASGDRGKSSRRHRPRASPVARASFTPARGAGGSKGEGRSEPAQAHEEESAVEAAAATPERAAGARRKSGATAAGATAKPKPIRPDAPGSGGAGGVGEDKKGGGPLSFPSDPASPFTLIPSAQRATMEAHIAGGAAGGDKSQRSPRVGGGLLPGHPPWPHAHDRQHRLPAPYYHPGAGMGVMGGEVGEGRPPHGRERERRSARYKGVTWDRVKRMWRVRLCLQGGARQHVGYYQDEEEGAIAYVTALSHAKAQGLSLKQDGAAT